VRLVTRRNGVLRACRRGFFYERLEGAPDPAPDEESGQGAPIAQCRHRCLRSGEDGLHVNPRTRSISKPRSGATRASPGMMSRGNGKREIVRGFGALILEKVNCQLAVSWIIVRDSICARGRIWPKVAHHREESGRYREIFHSDFFIKPTRAHSWPRKTHQQNDLHFAGKPLPHTDRSGHEKRPKYCGRNERDTCDVFGLYLKTKNSLAHSGPAFPRTTICCWRAADQNCMR